MAARDCPKCGLLSPAAALFCDCGYDFSRGQMHEGARAVRAEARSAGAGKIVLGVILIGLGTLSIVGTLAATNGGMALVWRGGLVFGIILIVRGVAERRARGTTSGSWASGRRR